MNLLGTVHCSAAGRARFTMLRARKELWPFAPLEERPFAMQGSAPALSFGELAGMPLTCKLFVGRGAATANRLDGFNERNVES